MKSFVSLLVPLLIPGAGLAFQAPTTVPPRTDFGAFTLNQVPPATRHNARIAWRHHDGSQDFREAIDFYKPEAETNAILANKTGIAYHQLQDLQNAEKYYRHAIKLNPKYTEAINNLGTVYYTKSPTGAR